MAAAEALHLAPAAGGELPLRLQRELFLLVESFYDDQGDVDVIGLGEAVARFAFEHELLYVPHRADLREQGVRFYPVTPHSIKPVWLARPAPAPGERPAPTERAPSLRDLGAEPIDG